jgi:hypothetical protein
MSLVSVLLAYTSYKKVADLKRWEKADATVISSKVVVDHRSKGTTYCPSVKISYKFRKQLQTSFLEIKDGPCSPIKGSINKIVAQYKPGLTVDVYVNPDQPTKSRVTTFSLGFLFYLGIFLSIVLGGCTVYLLFIPARNWGGKKDPIGTNDSH